MESLGVGAMGFSTQCGFFRNQGFWKRGVRVRVPCFGFLKDASKFISILERKRNMETMILKYLICVKVHMRYDGTVEHQVRNMMEF